MPPDAPGPSALLTALVAGGVDFVVIGGVAVLMQALPRFTKDLDIVPAPGDHNLERLGLVLTGLGARLRGVDDDVPFAADARTLKQIEVLTLETRLGSIDVLRAPSGAPAYEALAREADVYDIDGLRINVASIDHLIAMKRSAGRPQDLADIEALEIAADQRRTGA